MKIQPALTKLVVFASIVLNTTPRTQAIPRHHGSRHKAHHNNTTTHTGSHTRAAPASTCPTDGFSPSAASCMCNFAGACDISTDTPTSAAASSPRTLAGFAPQNVEGFAYDKGGATSVGTLCEKGTVAVLYDCNGRVPLYAATVLDGGKAGGKYVRRDYWRATFDAQLQTRPDLSAKNDDYDQSSKRIYCYEDNKGNEFNWDGSPCTSTKTAIHKGHMIAASYGQSHGGQRSVDNTFTFTNAVPQIGLFNSGRWMAAEKKVVAAAKDCECKASAKGEEGRLYVVVGAIPSTFLKQPRFFGDAGFGNFQGYSKNTPTKEFRIAFPEIMWTAGCCIHSDGTTGGTFAYWRRNWITKDQIKSNSTASVMFKDIQNEINAAWPGVTFIPPVVFPNQKLCN